MNKMDKGFDIFSCFVIDIMMIVAWVFKMLFTGDIPVEISFDEGFFVVFLLTSALVLYSIYFKYTSYFFLNIFLMILPSYLWFMSMLQALTYHYNKYDTLIDMFGFAVIIIAFIQLGYRKVAVRRDK